jgi:hypothetical protein
MPTPTIGLAPSHAPPDVRYAPTVELARSLGWFSIGLGLAEILATQQVARMTGVRHAGVLKAHGMREIATGIGILSSRSRPTSWMWGRVAGDFLDLTTLATAFAQGDHESRKATTTAAVAVVGVTTLDVVSALSLSAASRLEG